MPPRAALPLSPGGTHHFFDDICTSPKKPCTAMAKIPMDSVTSKFRHPTAPKERRNPPPHRFVRSDVDVIESTPGPQKRRWRITIDAGSPIRKSQAAIDAESLKRIFRFALNARLTGAKISDSEEGDSRSGMIHTEQIDLGEKIVRGREHGDRREKQPGRKYEMRK